MKKETQVLINTVMETAIATAWMLPVEVKQDIFLKGYGEAFPVQDPELASKDANLNYVVATEFFWNTWNRGYYSDLVKESKVVDYLMNMWDNL